MDLNASISMELELAELTLCSFLVHDFMEHLIQMILHCAELFTKETLIIHLNTKSTIS